MSEAIDILSVQQYLVERKETGFVPYKDYEFLKKVAETGDFELVKSTVWLIHSEGLVMDLGFQAKKAIENSKKYNTEEVKELFELFFHAINEEFKPKEDEGWLTNIAGIKQK